MATFALLGAAGVILQVIVVSDDALGNLPYPQSEAAGIAFLTKLYGHSNWKQTDINGAFRKNGAGIGYTYDSTRDAFIPPKPFSSAVLDEATARYKAPVPAPTDGGIYNWNEKTKNWESQAIDAAVSLKK